VVNFRRITRDDPLYPQAVELRQRILLDPIDYTMAMLEDEFPGFEDRFEHFVATITHPKGELVVGVVCLLPHSPDRTTGKLMQMAVEPQRQGEGIGRQLVTTLERRAFAGLGLTTLFCHSREDAVDFYQRCGWQTEGDRFHEAGIPHYKMVFSADAPST
jgi:predicted GNAT family N-acyltransferase